MGSKKLAKYVPSTVWSSVLSLPSSIPKCSRNVQFYSLHYVHVFWPEPSDSERWKRPLNYRSAFPAAFGDGTYSAHEPR